MFRRLLRSGAMALLPIAILMLAVGIMTFLRMTKPELGARPVAEKVWPVAVAEVAPGSERPRLRLEGEVVAGREAELRPLVAGTILELAPAFRDGGSLRRGELAVRIDPFAYKATVEERRAEWEQARAKLVELDLELAAEKKQLEHAREQWQLAQAELRRSQELLRRAAIAERALEEARVVESQRKQSVLNRDQAIGRLGAQQEQQRATVARLDWALQRAERNLAETQLSAPFDGFLYETNAAVGKQVGTGDKLARLVAAEMLEVRFHVPDALFHALAEGRLKDTPAVVRWRTGETVREYPAVLDRTDARIQAASGGVWVYARLVDLGADTPLRPGAYVSVEIAGQPQENVVRLPVRALFSGDTVYVVAEGRLEARPVSVAARDGDDLLLRGGLRAGERVVLTRFPEIAPGLKVSVP